MTTHAELPVMLAGETHNSTPTSAAAWELSLERACALQLDTVLAPVTWELLEPVEGHFDFSIPERLVEGARRHRLGLVPLWFGAFKNGMSTYAPDWVRFDQIRFPRACSEPGRHSATLSPLSESTRAADARAFSRLLRRLRELDPEGRVVRMVQVENEVGLLGAPRDRSPIADAAFSAPVPETLLAYLDKRRGYLHPWLEQQLAPPNARGHSSWSTVFGEGADEAFMAWHFASFVEAVAFAGRREWALPCFVNAWLLQYAGEPAGDHPSGGPMNHVRDLWQAAAPSLFALAPDIYLDDVAGVCHDYSGWQPLLIPEMKRSEQVAARLWYACGEHGARLVSPFGYESLGLAGSQPADGVVSLGVREEECSPAGADLLGRSVALLRSLLPLIGDRYGSLALRGLLQTDNLGRKFDLDGVRFQPRWFNPYDRSTPGAGGLIAALGEGRFIVAGFGFGLHAQSRLPGHRVEIAELWDGNCQDGAFVPRQRLNGDEHTLRLGSEPGLRMVRFREIAPIAGKQ